MGEWMTMLFYINLQAALIILVVLLVRLIFVRLHISKKYICLLWLLPYLCLILPYRPESSLSIWGVIPEMARESVFSDYGASEKNSSEEGINNEDWIDTESLSGIEIAETTQSTINHIDSNATKPTAHANTANNNDADVFCNKITIVTTIVWLSGVAILLLYSIISYVRLYRKVLCSICVEDNIYLSDDIEVPFVLGFIRPRIYLPSGMGCENLQFVIEHERTHILRKDSWKKAAAFLITGVHWINPLMWVAFCFLGKDIEMACDEETIQRIGMDKKRDYATTLLMVSVGKNRFRALTIPLAFGEGDTQGRIRNILKYKRTARVLAGVVIIFVLGLCVVFLTEPGKQQEEEREFESDNVVTEEVKSAEDKNDEVLTESIHITKPVMYAEIISGADGPIMDYASEDTVIFHDYYGLFVYRLEQGIIGAVDLEAIGCQYTQGDSACDIVVEQDGSKVYLHPMNSEEMYVYDVEQAALYRQKDETGNIESFSQIKDIRDCIDPDYTVLRSNQCITLDSGYHYLESGSGLPIDLAWVVGTRTEKGWEQTRYIKLFEEYAEDMGTTSSDSGKDSGETVLSEPGILEEFTMEKLIALCEEGREALKSAMDEFLIKDGLVYSNFVRHEYEYSLTNNYICELTYEGKEYELQVSYWKPEKAKEYGHTEYEVDGISICEAVSDDAQLLYTNEPERYIENIDILSFLEKEYDIGQYLSLTLPEGLTMTSYKKGMNSIWDGCMFVGEFEEQPHGSSCPESWYAPGGVGMYDEFEENPLFISSFENGRLTEIHWLFNHGGRETEGEYLEGCERQAILYEYSFDVFTAPEIVEYQEKYGLKEGELQAVSKYWYVFFAEPDSEFIYTVFLNQQHFTKEDVIELARSVKFVK